MAKHFKNWLWWSIYLLYVYSRPWGSENIYYLLSVNTEFVEWFSRLLNNNFSGWKGWDSLNLLLSVGTTSPSTLEDGHTCVHTSSDSVKASCPTVGCVCLLKVLCKVAKICIVLPSHHPSILLTGPSSALMSSSYPFFFMATLKKIEASYLPSPSFYYFYSWILSNALHMSWFSDPFQPDWMLTDRILEIEELSSSSYM